ncbi:MAG: LCP family protein [Thermoleophilaceae bacterium]
MEAGPPGGQPPRGDRPEYKVYRARRNPLDRFKPSEELQRLRSMRRRRDRGEQPERPRRRRRISLGRVVKWVLLAAVAWVLLSTVVFFVSAQTSEGVSERTKAALSDGGSLLSGSTILVIGSDQRPEGTQEPGAQTNIGRADSILLLRAGFGSVRRLSILRDSFAQIPGSEPQKINAAQAIGGTALTVETVEQFMGNGLRVNHVIEVDFEQFPEFIDALGGIDIELDNCIRAAPFGGRKFSLSRGEHHLNGRQALAFARVRQNRCARNEDDRARARRQQQVLAAIRDQVISPSTFFRLPLVSWEAPRTLKTDMKGVALAGLFTDLLTGGSGEPNVLLPSGFGPGGSLTVAEDEKAAAVADLLGR